MSDKKAYVINGDAIEKHAENGMNLATVTSINDNVKLLTEGRKYPFSATQSLSEKKSDELLAQVIKEWGVNAVDRCGTKLSYFLDQFKGMNFMCIMTDSTPFENIEDIINAFFTNEKSDGKGDSYYGGGAYVSALAASAKSNKAIIVGSNSSGGSGWVFVMGKKQGLNDFAVADVSKIFSKFSEILASQKFNNIIMIPVFLKDNEINSLINGDFTKTVIATLGNSKVSKLHITYYKDGVINIDDSFEMGNDKTNKALSKLLTQSEYDNCFNVILHDKTENLYNVPANEFRDFEGGSEIDLEVRTVYGVTLNCKRDKNSDSIRIRDLTTEDGTDEKGASVSRLTSKFTTYTATVCLTGHEKEIERLTEAPIALFKNHITKAIINRMGFYTSSQTRSEGLTDFSFLDNPNLPLTEDEKICIRDKTSCYSPEPFVRFYIKVCEIRNKEGNFRLNNVKAQESFEVLGRGTMTFSIDKTNALKDIIYECGSRLTTPNKDIIELNNAIFNIKEVSDLFVLEDATTINPKEGLPVIKLMNDSKALGLKAGSVLNKKNAISANKLIGTSVSLAVEIFNSETGEPIAINETILPLNNGGKLQSFPGKPSNQGTLTISCLSTPDGMPLNSTKDYYDTCLPHREIYGYYYGSKYVIACISGVAKNTNIGGRGKRINDGTPVENPGDKVKPVRMEPMPLPLKLVMEQDLSAPILNSNHPDIKMWTCPAPAESSFHKTRLKMLSTLTWGIQIAVANSCKIVTKLYDYMSDVSEEIKDIHKEPKMADINANLQICYDYLRPNLVSEYNKHVKKTGSGEVDKPKKDIKKKQKQEKEKPDGLQGLFDQILGEKSIFEKW